MKFPLPQPLLRPGHVSLGCLLLLAAPLAATPLRAQGNGYWHTQGSQILDASNRPVRIAGISWFGLETSNQRLHGLEFQDYHTILHAIKTSGFNTIRIPYSNQMVENPITPQVPPPGDKPQATINTDLAHLTSLEILDRIMQAAGTEGLRIILDNHRSDAGDSNERTGLWYSGRYPESAWIADWQLLAERYKSYTDADGNPTLIGVDLRNEPFLMVNGEPRGSCWTGDAATNGCPVTDTAHNWPAAAQRAAAAIQTVNPQLLIVVEGVDCYNHDCNWQGGNLQGVADHPVKLSAAGHLVYSAHDYGPSVSPQPWFTPVTTAELLSQHWIKNWAYLAQQNVAPVWVGEFGTTAGDHDTSDSAPGSQGQWFSTLISFLHTNPRIHWAYWAVNSEDATGLFASNYTAPSPSSAKLQQLATIQFPLNPSAPLVAPAGPDGQGVKPAFALSGNHMDLLVIGGGLSLTLAALVLVELPGFRRSKTRKPEKAKTK